MKERGRKLEGIEVIQDDETEGRKGKKGEERSRGGNRWKGGKRQGYRKREQRVGGGESLV